MSKETVLERKTIHISGKRQITIPQKYFDELGFGKEAECILQNNMILLKPVRENTGGDFAEQILADLIAQGYSGEALLKKFKDEQKKVRPAIEKMLDQATEAAKGNGEYSTYHDIFGSEE
ncbi:AbrB/MazE/SpoVT family DNA-binding domain-containing protein [Acetobacterium fimetarium]|uniref:AbrB/MazE/SpoVT family DNA-binding domain-containing protein n=1 Tax=Acetobacterium fimetarium TaxID=52691 RepID=A0ABR6WQX9_9FIRM|nr:AbrB/MazE/SpoVT family DNA-binding domain-containing protein [Acetobacterium fimetarium]MBC3802976.1 AbrB/MazE/SpoVT family DNA-binding domain-containing protein [Acetobacterium fimetarium]